MPIKPEEVEFQTTKDDQINPYTRFFREPVLSHPKALLERVKLLEKVLVVGCSSGEEPCSLAISLLQEGVENFLITGIDISEDLLAKARRGKYQILIAPSYKDREIGSGSQIPQELAYSEQFFRAEQRVEDSVQITISELLRSHLRYLRRDARTSVPPGPFDIAICQNVLIHHSPKDRDKIIKNCILSLKKRGFILVEMEERIGPLTSLGRALMLDEYNRYLRHLSRLGLRRVRDFSLGRLFQVKG